MALVSDGAAFDQNPGRIDAMPVRPYRVLHVDLPFCSDAECSNKVAGASLIVLRSEDPKQTHQVVECLPTRKKYQAGQLVKWDLDKDVVWQESWYRNPETGATEKAWTQCVEFTGPVVTVK